KEAISYWQSTAKQILPNSPLADRLKSDVEQAAELAKIEIPNLTFLNVPAVNIDDIESQNNLIDVNKDTFEKKLSQFSDLSQN
ncbi:hypothetical protein IDF54_14490, partial [Flavobacterium sp. SaA2.13]|uniref:hypothetical protein n=1 Tax=Flavobacterium sp. SaA2.13 TaxID=2691898 RepID=UPI00178C50E2